jgi:hypothetical protein
MRSQPLKLCQREGLPTIEMDCKWLGFNYFSNL